MNVDVLTSCVLTSWYPVVTVVHGLRSELLRYK